MKRPILSTILASLILAGCGTATQPGLAPAGGQGLQALKAPSAPARPFTLATYNVENLFDNSTVKPDPKSAPPKPEAAKKALAASMRALNADVVTLVEVESEGTLRRFRDQYLKDMGYTEVVLHEGNDGRGIDVAVLSRFPVTHIKSHKDAEFNVPGSDPQKLSRDLLQVDIKAGKGYVFTLFATHLKAHAGGATADAKRLAEATYIRKVLRDFEKEHRNANYALCGDFNDGPETPALKTLLDGRDRDAKLYDVLAELGTTPTYVKPPYIGRIDFILLSEGMHRDYQANSARILDNADARAASDHVPASIVIDATKDK